MAETKYGKYFLSRPEPGQERKADGMINLDGDVIKGSFFFTIDFISQPPTAGIHGPHAHPNSEILGFFGINPDDPFDLGAEIELCMGEELEKHTFTESTLVYIPPGLVHCPLVYKRIDRPFIFLYSLPVPKVHEKPYQHLVPENERGKMFFLDK
jgi:hypothetical protein